MLEELMAFLLGCRKDETRSYVDKTVKHLPLLNAWIGCVVTEMDTAVDRGG